jgi:hypothetical protein
MEDRPYWWLLEWASYWFGFAPVGMTYAALHHLMVDYDPPYSDCWMSK